MSWQSIVDTLVRFQLEHQIDASPTDASWRIDGEVPEHPSEAAITARLPRDYVQFVSAHGYPLLAAPARLDYAFAFLPPLAMRQVSAQIADNQDAEGDGFVMFAGWNLSNVDGWAFGRDPENDDAPPLVWLIEDSQVLEPVGSFAQWLRERADDIAARLARLTPADLRQVQGREGDYAYGPLDLQGFD